MICYYAECRILFTIMLSVIMLSVVLPKIGVKIADKNNICCLKTLFFMTQQQWREKMIILHFLNMKQSRNLGACVINFLQP